MVKTYIHVNQHKIRSNKKHGTNESSYTVKRGSRNDYCLLKYWAIVLFVMVVMISLSLVAVLELL